LPQPRAKVNGMPTVWPLSDPNYPGGGARKPRGGGSAPIFSLPPARASSRAIRYRANRGPNPKDKPDGH